MLTEPRHRRRLIPVFAILLALVIALPVALSRSEAASSPPSTESVSDSATEAQNRPQTDVDLWAGIEEAAALHEQQKKDEAEWYAAVAAAEAEAAAAAAEEQRRQEAAAAAAAEKERQEAAAAQKAAAAKQQTTTTAASKPAAPAPAPAARSTSGNCGGWEGLISSYFSDVGTACRVMMCESEGNPRAQNPSGASGLFQVMPEWASRYQQVTGVPYYDGRFDPNANTAFAAYLVNAEGWASQFDCY